MNVRVHEVYEPVLMANVYFLYSGSQRDLRQWYSSKGISSDVDAKLKGYVELLDYTKEDSTVERSYIIRIEENDFYTLAHECIHLVRHILTDRGIPFTPENDEIIAYYHGYWLKRLWRLSNK